MKEHIFQFLLVVFQHAAQCENKQLVKQFIREVYTRSIERLFKQRVLAAVENARDRRVLRQTGLAEEHLRVLQRAASLSLGRRLADPCKHLEAVVQHKHVARIEQLAFDAAFGHLGQRQRSFAILGRIIIANQLQQQFLVIARSVSATIVW
jgi:hypothetical protein